MLQQGESLIQVKKQMGHSSINATVDNYGPKYLRKQAG
jgi:hypothetical protein